MEFKEEVYFGELRRGGVYALQFAKPLRPGDGDRIKAKLRPFEKKHDISFLLLDGGVTIAGVPKP